MIIRRLEKSEHAKTRALYEAVFTEDDEAFVDYYYEWKTRDNRIYAAEDDSGIHAMVHLNPFHVYQCGEIRTLHYIVAVATQKEYRHQGLMRKLLALAEREMQEAGEEFTFLMPASEKIYYPLGYRYFCAQRQGVMPAEENAETVSAEDAVSAAGTVKAAEIGNQAGNLPGFPEECTEDYEDYKRAVCRPVLPPEYGMLTDFANAALKQQYDIFIWRDEAYYERLCAEQQCQNGAVMAIWHEGSIIGTFCAAMADENPELELRELIQAAEYREEAEAALRDFVNRYGGCKISGCPEDVPLENEMRKPLLMGKVPGGGAFQNRWEDKRIFINEVV